MPEWKMENDHLWRQHMQKAALDKYVRLRLRHRLALGRDVKERRLRAYGVFFNRMTVDKLL